MQRWRLPQPHWADLITLTGLILTVNEAMFHSGPERPGFQFMFLAMMGVSPAVRIDERRNQQRHERRQAEAKHPAQLKKDEGPVPPPGGSEE